MNRWKWVACLILLTSLLLSAWQNGTSFPQIGSQTKSTSRSRSKRQTSDLRVTFETTISNCYNLSEKLNVEVII